MSRFCKLRRGGFVLILLAVSGCTTSQKISPDARFHTLAEGYLRGHLAWRPGFGMSLGRHEYDGRLTDFSRASLDSELKRLKEFERRLSDLPMRELGAETLFDCQILLSAIGSEIFGFESARAYTRNPMTYARAIDLTQYVKRDFAPLRDRVRSIISIEQQTPALFSAARINLDSVLPTPFVETAIDIAEGNVAFLEKDLPIAVNQLKDDALLAEFKAANAMAISEMRGFARWLRDERLPNANSSF